MDIRPSLFGLLSALGAAVSVATAAPSVEWHGATEIAKGRGEKGPWRQNESRYDYVDDPTVALDRQGDIYVAWVEQGRKDVLFQRLAADDARPRGAPVNVSRNPDTFSWLPRMVVLPDQRVLMLWQEIIFSGGSHGGDILFASSDDGGRTFTEPMNLSRSIGGDGKGRIARDVWHNGSFDIVATNDAVYAVWTEYDGPLWLARSFDAGKTFTPPQRIAPNAAPTRAPALALSPDGTVYLAWTTGTDEGADIQLAISTDRGATFSEPRAIAPSASYSDAPKLAVDRNGVLHLVYAESDGGPFGRFHIRYTRSTDGARTFDPTRDISRASAGAAAYPALGIDARGNVHVIWELCPGLGEGPRGLGYAISHDGGHRFTSPATVPDSADAGGGTNGSQQGLLMQKLAVNDARQVAVVNSALKRNKHSRVWLIQGRIFPLVPNH